MSCTVCQTRFTFFTKKTGCPRCGFTCCSKCLKYKYKFPNEEKKRICGPCYYKLETQSKGPDDVPMSEETHKPFVQIDATKMLDSFEKLPRPPNVTYQQNNKLDNLNLRDGLNSVDHDIINRLEKLKGNDKQVSIPTEDEIRRRLALLRDEDPDNVNRSVNRIGQRKTEETPDDLINEYVKRFEISLNNQVDSDIQARLDNLKEFNRVVQVSKEKFRRLSEDDEETAVKKIIDAALSEAALERKYGDNSDDEDEL